MDFLYLELILWVGLAFFLWKIQNNLDRVASSLESIGLFPANQTTTESQFTSYDRPDKLLEVIGFYKDKQIYRYAVIDGLNYQFDHVLPAETDMNLYQDERCLEPGLVYVECQELHS